MSESLTLTDAQRSSILRPPGLRSAGAPVIIGMAVVLAALILLPFIPGMRFYYLQVVIVAFFFAIVGTAWGVIGGYAGQHSVGNAAFVGIGAYTSTLLYVNFGISPWIGMVVGMAASALIAVIIGYPCFRLGLRGDYFTLATVALGLVAFEIVTGWSTVTHGAQGVPISFKPDPAAFQFQDRNIYYFIGMAMWLAAVLVSYRLRHSRKGFEMLAVRDDEAAAARGGISVLRSKLSALVISAVITSAAGTFYAQFYLFIDPNSVMSLNLSIQIVLVVALGGMNSYLGGTVGAIILVPTAQFLSVQFASFPGVDLALYGVALVLIMMYMPFGVLGLLRKSPRWRKVIGW
jgi:branched-chain amino acid transport system permease protein